MKIRIRFRKYGVMKFIGHLDVMRYFQKAMRRAHIDICYSEGFSPHQIMSFASPLGVGITSDGEYLDIEVHSTKSTDESRDALNAVMVDGIEITEYVVLRQDAKKAMTSVAAADYIVYFKNQVDFTQEELGKKIHQYYEERETIEVTKQTKKSERVIDIKPLIYVFHPCDLKELGWQGFFLQLSAGSTDNIKPELVLQDFYQYFGKKYHPFNMQIHRVETYEHTENGLRPLYQAGDVIEA